MSTRWEYKWIEFTLNHKQGAKIGKKIENPERGFSEWLPAEISKVVPYAEHTDPVALLNSFGSEGWEAVSAHNDVNRQWVLLKRMISEA
jgi:hypothetical protein